MDSQQQFEEKLRVYLEIYGYRLFSKALRQSIAPILKALQESESVAFSYSISEIIFTEAPIADAMKIFYTKAWNKQNREFIKWLKASFPPKALAGVGFGNPIMDAALKDYFNTVGLKHITEINDVTRAKIKKAFETALANNEGFRGAERRLIKETNFSKTRARMIARTESCMVTNQAKYDQAALLDFKMESHWLHDHPITPRKWHIGIEPVDFGESFNVGGVKMKFPGDQNGGAKNIVNCKCILITKAKYDAEGNLIYK